jgi:hypothetical protein
VRRILAAACVICALALPAYAQDDLEARQAAAEQIVGITTTDTIMQAMNEAVWPPVRDTIVQQNPDVTAEQLAAMEGVMADVSGEIVAEMSVDLVDFYAAEFSLDELNALVDFYTSPVGRKYQAKLPELMAKVTPTILQKTQEMGPRLLEELRKAAEERGLRIDI